MDNLKRQKFSIVYLTIAYLIPFILQAILFGYQVSKGIVSIWNLITTVMMIFLYIYAFRNVRNANFELDERVKKEKETFDMVLESQKKKMSIKSRFIIVFVAVVFAALSGLFFHLYSSKTEGLTLVNSKVVDQWGETTVVTEETDEGIEQTESDYIEVTVEYEFDGETKGAIIKATTTDNIYVDELKIYVDENGKFVNDYGRIAIWKFEAITFLSFACFMLLCAIFGLGVEFVGGAVFMVIGTSLMFLIGCPLFENFLYNDLTCFALLFANVGLCLFICGILVLIFGRFSVYGLYNTLLKNHPAKVTTREIEKESDDVFAKCENCGEKVNETDKFCGNCGNKLKINKKEHLICSFACKDLRRCKAF